MHYIILVFIELFKFIKDIAIAWSKRVITFGWMVAVNVASLATFVTYIYSLIKCVTWVYEKINYLINFINISAFGGDDILSRSIQVAIASGAYKGLVDAFNILLDGLIFYFSALLTKYTMKVIMQVRINILSLIIAFK